jgi:hypothetical protein
MKAPLAQQQRHPVTRQLVLDDIDFFAHHVSGARGQVTHGDIGFQPIRLTVELALIESGEIENGLAKSFRRDGAGVDAHAAHHVAALDHRRTLAEFGRGDCRLLPGGAGPDDNKVVMIHDDFSQRRYVWISVTHHRRRHISDE